MFRTVLILLLMLPAVAAGCGTTKQSEAKQQLLASDAVDRSIARIDFTPLSGQTVYFDTSYITNYKGIGFVNAEYVVSSLRQQLFSAGCLVQEKREDAEYVVEARIGTLGNDEHDIVYGVPANNALSAASSVVPNTPPLPTIPEISFARREDQAAAAKIAAFAYHRESREPVWQSGLSLARSTSKDTWLLGAGPFERGTIHDGWYFAGSRFRFPLLRRKPKPLPAPVAAYSKEMLFQRPPAADETPDEAEAIAADSESAEAEEGVEQASAEETESEVQQADASEEQAE
ncbi:MAG: hypothetical protein DWQ34_27355 [Planctomycetota bacterium]|nr:MAG: hypothetical protein DWQ34_27355 [Planctomycetota bacterium]REK26117.1 MAG: hypothetical protein DWQ41_10705 [Planctomycetota bacterium]REK33487.1 MAG: hypothetical protein DWQ45_14975 [Planctomycetota bacterium]